MQAVAFEHGTGEMVRILSILSRARRLLMDPPIGGSADGRRAASAFILLHGDCDGTIHFRASILSSEPSREP
jgi:hypothetical protein